MAGDWLKVEKETPEKPEVFSLARELKISQGEAFLACFRVWSWADSHSEDGIIPMVTAAMLDSISRVSGFANALESVGWLNVRASALQVPNFDRHMGQSAKTRALDSSRKRRHRSGKMSGKCPDANRTKRGPEKRREEKNKDPPTPLEPFPKNLDVPAFRALWDQWRCHRQEIGHALKPTSAQAQLRRLDGWGLERATRALEHSLANGYQGIFEAKEPQQELPEEESPEARRARTQAEMRAREAAAGGADAMPLYGQLAAAFRGPNGKEDNHAVNERNGQRPEDGPDGRT